MLACSLSRLLGAHVPIAGNKQAAATPAPPPPYQFGQPDTEATIVIVKEPDQSGQVVRQVKYATPEKAVEHLTFPVEHCPGYARRMPVLLKT